MFVLIDAIVAMSLMLLLQSHVTKANIYTKNYLHTQYLVLPPFSSPFKILIEMLDIISTTQCAYILLTLIFLTAHRFYEYLCSTSSNKQTIENTSTKCML